jgi:hypothetical protein
MKGKGEREQTKEGKKKDRTKVFCSLGVYEVKDIDAIEDTFKAKIRMHLFWKLNYRYIHA